MFNVRVFASCVQSLDVGASIAHVDRRSSSSLWFQKGKYSPKPNTSTSSDDDQGSFRLELFAQPTPSFSTQA